MGLFEKSYYYYFNKERYEIKTFPSKSAVVVPRQEDLKGIHRLLNSPNAQAAVLAKEGVVVSNRSLARCAKLLEQSIYQGKGEIMPFCIDQQGLPLTFNGTWVVKFNKGTKLQQWEELCNEFEASMGDPINKEHRVYCIHYHGDPTRFFQNVNSLYETGSVEYAYPNFISAVRMDAPPLSQDPMYPSQTALQALFVEDAWAAINASPNTPTPIKIAVLDEGIHRLHPDLRGVHWQEDFDRMEENNGGVPLSGNAHGTAMAGIIGAVNNQLLMVGVAHNAILGDIRIACVRDRVRLSSDRIVIEGIDKAVSWGAHVINMSWSHPYSSGIQDAIKRAIARNVAVVCAAGNVLAANEANNLKFPAYLAINSPVVAVGACKMDGTPVLWADGRGFATCLGLGLTLLAPGVDVHTLTLANGAAPSAMGTSAAAALISGVVGLMKTKQPGLTPAQIKQMLSNTAATIGGGRGLANAVGAVQAALVV